MNEVIEDIDLDVKGATAAITYDGNTTIACVSIYGQLGIGIAKCMPTDKYSKEIGQNLALWRAVRSVIDLNEQLWLERSTTKVEWEARHQK